MSAMPDADPTSLEPQSLESFDFNFECAMDEGLTSAAEPVQHARLFVQDLFHDAPATNATVLQGPDDGTALLPNAGTLQPACISGLQPSMHTFQSPQVGSRQLLPSGSGGLGQASTLTDDQDKNLPPLCAATTPLQATGLSVPVFRGFPSSRTRRPQTNSDKRNRKALRDMGGACLFCRQCAKKLCPTTSCASNVY